jgi:hypothetical protein
MTIAVCLRCGELKHGALTPCPACSYTPAEAEDQARHLMVSDHYHSRDALEGISARVKRGEPLQFDAQQVRDFVATINSNSGGRVGLYVFGFFALLVVVVVGVIWLFGRVMN